MKDIRTIIPRYLFIDDINEIGLEIGLEIRIINPKLRNVLKLGLEREIEVLQVIFSFTLCDVISSKFFSETRLTIIGSFLQT